MTIVTMGMSGCWSRSRSSCTSWWTCSRVCDLSEGEHIEREIALVKRAPPVVHVTN